jgi:hypothetical protein
MFITTPPPLNVYMPLTCLHILSLCLFPYSVAYSLHSLFPSVIFLFACLASYCPLLHSTRHTRFLHPADHYQAQTAYRSVAPAERYGNNSFWWLTTLYRLSIALEIWEHCFTPVSIWLVRPVLPTFAEGKQYIVNEIPFRPKGIFAAGGAHCTRLTAVEMKRDPIYGNECRHHLMLPVRRNLGFRRNRSLLTRLYATSQQSNANNLSSIRLVARCPSYCCIQTSFWETTAK